MCITILKQINQVENVVLSGMKTVAHSKEHFIVHLQLNQIYCEEIFIEIYDFIDVRTDNRQRILKCAYKSNLKHSFPK